MPPTGSELLQEVRLLRKEIADLRRLLVIMKADTSEWLTAGETGLTRNQLRYIRDTRPERVKQVREGVRIYLYKM